MRRPALPFVKFESFVAKTTTPAAAAAPCQTLSLLVQSSDAPIREIRVIRGKSTTRRVTLAAQTAPPRHPLPPGDI